MTPADLIAAWELALVNGPIVITPALIQRTLAALKEISEIETRLELAQQDAQYSDTP